MKSTIMVRELCIVNPMPVTAFARHPRPLRARGPRRVKLWPELERIVQQVHKAVDAHRARLGLPPYCWRNTSLPH